MYQYVTEYRRHFSWRHMPDAGFSFACDRDGTLHPLNPVAQISFRECTDGTLDVIDRGIISFERRILVCNCGSGKSPATIYDARGICVARVCGDCRDRVFSRYRPEIFTNPNYAD